MVGSLTLLKKSSQHGKSRSREPSSSKGMGGEGHVSFQGGVIIWELDAIQDLS